MALAIIWGWVNICSAKFPDSFAAVLVVARQENSALLFACKERKQERATTFTQQDPILAVLQGASDEQPGPAPAAAPAELGGLRMIGPRLNLSLPTRSGPPALQEEAGSAAGGHGDNGRAQEPIKSSAAFPCLCLVEATAVTNPASVSVCIHTSIEYVCSFSRALTAQFIVADSSPAWATGRTDKHTDVHAQDMAE